MNKISELNKLRNINRLKSVYRENSVGKRKESSAEHSWSCLIIADYFLGLKNYNINPLRVYELLMYHDLVEIEAGDTPLSKKADRNEKAKKEAEAAKRLASCLPDATGKKFIMLFKEFEEGLTIEAKFARAVDALDAQIHEMDYKEDWAGWTEEYLRESKEKCFEDFTEMRELFEEIILFFRKNDYFDG